jgi:5'/3'-nucleotidase SurE
MKTSKFLILLQSMDILLTNDDGYSSIGFYPLLEKLSKKFKVSAIAPNAQKSWVGKSITAHAKLESGVQKQVNLSLIPSRELRQIVSRLVFIIYLKIHQNS